MHTQLSVLNRRHPKITDSSASGLSPVWFDDVSYGLQQMDPIGTGGGIAREELEFLKHKLRARITHMANSFNQNRYKETTWENLLSHQYIAFDGPHYRAFIVMDVDKPEHFEKLRRFPLAPNLIGLRASAHHRGNYQAIWILRFPVKKADRLVLRWMERIMTAMGEALGADPHFSRHLSRNPFYSLKDAAYSWHWLHDRQFLLTQLQDACQMVGVELQRTQKTRGEEITVERVAGVDRGPRVGPNEKFRPFRYEIGGEKILRNCWLFLAVTEHARLHSGPVTEEWCLDLLHEANGIMDKKIWTDSVGTNPHTPPWLSYGLDDKELRTIARSISQYWSATSRSGLSWYTKEEASLGGKRTQQRHRVKILDQLEKGRETSLAVRVQRALKRRESVRILLEEGLSKRAISKRLNVNERTIYRDVIALMEEASRKKVETASRSTTFVRSQKDRFPHSARRPPLLAPSISLGNLLHFAQTLLNDSPQPPQPI